MKIVDLQKENTALLSDAQHVKSRIAAYEDLDKGAVLRQIAICSETEYKLQLVKAMKTQSKSRNYLRSGAPNMNEVNHTKLTLIEKTLRQENYSMYQELERTFFSKNKNACYGALRHLKKLSSDAHPTNYKGRPVDFNIARELVKTMCFRPPGPGMPTIHADLGTVRAEAHRIVEVLADVRKDQALLESYY